MKKVLMIIGGVVLGLVVLGVAIFFIFSLLSKDMVCKSPEGNITLMYSDKAIVGYTASGGLTYDLETQQKYAEEIGVEAYLDEFAEWFRTNTSGTCKR